MAFNILKKLNQQSMNQHISEPETDSEPVSGVGGAESADAEVENVQEPEEAIADSEEKTVDESRLLYENIKRTLIRYGQEYPGLVQFAQYIQFKGYIALNPDYKKEECRYVDCMVKVNFCSMKSIKSYNPVYGCSRLQQCYRGDIFANYPFTVYVLKDDPLVNLVGCCVDCAFGDQSFPLCPYKFAGIALLVAEYLEMNIDDLFKEILKEKYRVYHVPKKVELDAQERTFYAPIDAKSARAAYIMLQAQLVELVSWKDNIIQYQCLPLCMTRDKSGLVKQIVDFWENRENSPREISAYKEVLSVKQTGCEECEFSQCPDRIAAYVKAFCCKYGKNPIDVTYTLSLVNTIANLTPAQHYKFQESIDRISNMPFLPESNQETLKILRYIVNRRQNALTPLLPLNLVIHTNDEALADEFFDVYLNALWFYDYFKNEQDITDETISLAAVSLDKLIQKYENAKNGSVFHIKQMELLENDPAVETLMPKLCMLIKEKVQVFTVVSGDKYLLEHFFSQYPELYYRILTHHLFVTQMKSSSVVKVLLKKLEENFELEPVVVNRIRDFVEKDYESNELKSNSYAEWLYDKIVFNHYNNELGVSNVLFSHDIPGVKPRRSEEEIFREIYALTGLQNVKATLEEINDYIKYKMKTKRSEASRPNMHMVFHGNAGTGKTTVAKLTAEILYSIGFIRQNKLVVTSGKDFIAEYLGQSQMKTVQKCEQAYGGVLFIDEAYQLNPYEHNSQTDTLKLDAVNELIQQMENNRDRLIVIFAGYTKEMHDFIKNANPGLASRIAYTIEFPDYSDEELLSIFKGIVDKAGISLTDRAIERVRYCIRAERAKGDNFGNARFVRTLFERSQMLHAKNTRDLVEGDARLYILSEQDISYQLSD